MTDDAPTTTDLYRPVYLISWMICLTVYVATFLFFVAAALFQPVSGLEYNGHEMAMVIDPGINDFLNRWGPRFALAFAAIPVISILIRVGSRYRLFPRPRVTAIIFGIEGFILYTLFSIVLGCAFGNIWDIDPWIPPVTGPDSHQYFLVTKEALQGTKDVIAREVSPLWYARRFEALTTDYMDAPDIQVPIIRPMEQNFRASAPERPGPRLYAAETGWIVLLQGNECNMAYDIKRDLAYVESPYSKREKDITELSPFVLIGPGMRLNPGDEEDLIRTTRYSAATTRPNRSSISPYPRPEVLHRDLQHPNPEVRRLVVVLEESRKGKR